MRRFGPGARSIAGRKGWRVSFGSLPGVFEKPAGPRRIEYAAGTEAAHVADRLLGRAAALLHPVDHLFRERRTHHSVPAHRRKHQHIRIDEMLRLGFETEGIADAVPAQTSRVAAQFRTVDRGRDIHAQTQIGLADRLQQVFGGGAVVEHRGGRGGRIQARDDGIEVELGIALPMGERIHRARWPERTSMTRIAEVDRIKFARHLEKLPELWHRIFVVLPAAAQGENNVVVAEAVHVADAMQSVGHRAITSLWRGTCVPFVIRPRSWPDRAGNRAVPESAPPRNLLRLARTAYRRRAPPPYPTAFRLPTLTGSPPRCAPPEP